MLFYWYALPLIVSTYLIRPLSQRVGDKTPADLMLFAATDLKVDNSSLTGESEPQERFPLPDGSTARPVEADNLVDFLNALTMDLCLPNTVGFQFHARGQWRSLGRQVIRCSWNIYRVSLSCSFLQWSCAPLIIRSSVSFLLSSMTIR